MHDPDTAARLASEEAENPVPVMASAPEEETEEEAEQREAEYEQRRKEHEAEQQRREEERKAEQERQQQEYEAIQQRREELNKARVATFERILDLAPATFSAAQFRTFLRLLIQIDLYSFLEEVGSYFAGNDENTQQTDEEIVLAALDSTADDKLTGLALRLVLTDHLGIPHQDQPDLLAEAEAVFAPPQAKVSKPKSVSKSEKAPTEVKTPKKTTTKKQKAA